VTALERKELLIGRLIVLLQALLLPVYFFGLFWGPLTAPDIVLISNPTLELLITRILGPLFLLFPWLAFTVVHRYRLADTYSSAGETIARMPTVLIIFYTFNFVLALCFFILPLLSPLLAIFSGWFLYSLLFESNEEEKNEKETPKLRVFLTLLLAPIPLLFVVSYMADIGALLTDLWTFWIGPEGANIDRIYTSGVNLASAAAIGGFLYLIYEGAAQIDHYVEIPTKPITILSLGIFIGTEALFIQAGWQTPLYLRAFHYLGLGCWILAFIIRTLKGLGHRYFSGANLVSLLLVLPFILLELLRRSHFEKSSLVVVNAIIFLLILFRSWYAAGQPNY